MSVACDVRTFQASDLSAFEPQRNQGSEARLLSEYPAEVRSGLSRCVYAVTLLRAEVPMACMGLLPVWRGRAIAWAVIAQDVGVSGLLRLVKVAEIGMKEAQFGRAYRRIETTVRSDFVNGIQMAMMLGFAIDGEMPCYDPEGNSYLMMSRIGRERY